MDFPFEMADLAAGRDKVLRHGSLKMRRGYDTILLMAGNEYFDDFGTLKTYEVR